MTGDWSSRLIRRIDAARRDPMILALIVTAALVAVLAIAVFVASSAGTDDDSATVGVAGRSGTTTASGVTGPTPTPRVIRTATAVPGRTAPAVPTAVPAPANVRVADERVATATSAPTSPPRPTSTPRPRITATTAPTDTPETLYQADAEEGFEALAGPSWMIGESRQLLNDGSAVQPQQWNAIPGDPPDGAYAVEAEIRVRGLNTSYCNLTFGLAGGLDEDRAVWGGGILYPCDVAGLIGKPQARITDVANWSDGYHLDRELGAEDFDPEQEWHTYRFEVRGSRLRLLIDGEPVLETTDDQVDAAPTADGGPIGLWSQGVQLAVRRITVTPL